MMADLYWKSLEHHRAYQQLTMFHKFNHDIVNISITSYIILVSYITRNSHILKFTQLYCHTDIYAYSFHLIVIRMWNTYLSPSSCPHLCPLSSQLLWLHPSGMLPILSDSNSLITVGFQSCTHLLIFYLYLTILCTGTSFCFSARETTSCVNPSWSS